MSEPLLSALVSAAAAIIGAVVGGLFTVWGAIKAVKITSQDLELEEIRQQKVLCITTLAGLRWVIGNPQAPDEYKSKCLYELNKISMLWADDNEVMNNLRDFYGGRSNEKFVLLFRSLGRSTKLSSERLGDVDILNIFSMQMTSR